MEPTRYFLDRDGDGHWYLVQAKFRAEWHTWEELDPEDEASWEPPWFAQVPLPATATFSTNMDTATTAMMITRMTRNRTMANRTARTMVNLLTTTVTATTGPAIIICTSRILI